VGAWIEIEWDHVKFQIKIVAPFVGAWIEMVLEYLKENPIIPLTDNDKVSAPDVVSYNLEATYYIARSDINNVASIKDSIEAAKDTYLNWQKTKIGRDINPDALTEFVRAAGGKRVVITSPVFTQIPETSIAQEANVEFVYGGIEDD
jgi:phage-related baseplate assembly protein